MDNMIPYSFACDQVNVVPVFDGRLIRDRWRARRPRDLPSILLGAAGARERVYVKPPVQRYPRRPPLAMLEYGAPS